MLEAYYPDAVRAGGAARQRAQATQGVVAGLFSATVGFTVATANLRDGWIIALGLFSLCFWSAATGFFVSAIGMPVAADASVTDITGPDNFVREVLRRARTERDQVAKRHRCGVFLALVALLSTIAFWGCVAFTSLPRTGVDVARVQVTIAPTGRELVRTVCPAVDTSRAVMVERLAITEGPFAEMAIGPNTCGTTERVVIHLPSDDILAYGAT